MYEKLLPALSVLNKLDQERYRRMSFSLLRRAGVICEGTPLWISPWAYFDLSTPGCITLGDRCVISHHVKLLTHDYSPSRIVERRHGLPEDGFWLQASIRVGASSFLGMGALILPGVQIGAGAIIGAGSVVTKDVPADTIWAGNPAKHICTTAEYWDRHGNRIQRNIRGDSSH